MKQQGIAPVKTIVLSGFLGVLLSALLTAVLAICVVVGWAGEHTEVYGIYVIQVLGAIMAATFVRGDRKPVIEGLCAVAVYLAGLLLIAMALGNTYQISWLCTGLMFGGTVIMKQMGKKHRDGVKNSGKYGKMRTKRRF